MESKKQQPSLENPFELEALGLDQERINRNNLHDKRISFGHSYLDDALDGIYANDLMIVTAKTGSGKTDFLVSLAHKASAAGNRVHFFSLESERKEVLRRIKFKVISRLFFAHPQHHSLGPFPDYQRWMHGLQTHLDQFEDDAADELKSDLRTLHTRYRKKEFTADDFEREVLLIQDKTDLILVDHLHYFDLFSENENREMKQVVKTIRHVAESVGKPVILLAHIRKSDRSNAAIVPSEEDIHGSSDIAKISTQVVSFAPAFDIEPPKWWLLPTYCRITKNRNGMNRTHFTAVSYYDTRNGVYSDEYDLGRLTMDQKAWHSMDQLNAVRAEKSLTRIPFPEWSVRAKKNKENNIF